MKFALDKNMEIDIQLGGRINIWWGVYYGGSFPGSWRENEKNFDQWATTPYSFQ